MRNILLKEMKLSASILSYLFIAFGLMFFIPGYPILCGVFFVTLGIFQSFQNAREANDLVYLGSILKAQGWTALTALNVMLFSLFHFPCSTTLLTVWKETRSVKWTALAFLLPLLTGIGLCMLTTGAANAFMFPIS